MKISIVIPAYNAEKTIERCINSVFRQTYSDIELIVINDGSNDKTDELIQKLVVNRQGCAYVSQVNRGVSMARNIGIESATGEYILFLDSDDYIPDEFCERLHNLLIRFGEKSLCMSCMHWVDEAGHELKRNCYSKEEDISIIERKNILELDKFGLLNAPVNKLYSLGIIRKYGVRFDANLTIAEDLLFNIKYIEKMKSDEKICIDNMLFYNVELCTVGTSLSSKPIFDFWKIHEPVLKEYKKLLYKCGTSDWTLYYARLWDYLNRALGDNMLDSTLDEKARIKKNTQILKEKDVQIAIKTMKSQIALRRYLLLRSGRYGLIYLDERLPEVIKKIFGRSGQ